MDADLITVFLLAYVVLVLLWVAILPGLFTNFCGRPPELRIPR